MLFIQGSYMVPLYNNAVIHTMILTIIRETNYFRLFVISLNKVTIKQHNWPYVH